MVKKAFTILSIVLLLGFASCGGGSSKEAKELLQKILQFVGIPQDIVVNVCQDSNRDGICGRGEIFTKVVISRGDDINNILRKISLTPDGKYFLETYNPKLPILVELQDEAKINFDNGKFTLSFNGFKTNENNETKEISILESMVEANALSKNIADKFRTLNNAEAQDKYYVALLDSLEKNINILRSNDFDSKIAVSLAIKEMGNKITINQNQADIINNCENNQTCIDNEIKRVSEELIITDEEIIEIKAEENNSLNTNANNSSSSKNGWVVPNGIMKDEIHENNYIGKTIPEFIDLSEIDVKVTDINILVTITFVNLSNEFIYNNEKVEENTLEYGWSIYFNADEDDNTWSEGDISFRILKYKFSSSSPKKSKNILNFTQQNIWINGRNQGSISSMTTIDKNKIIFDVPKSINTDLNKITSSTQIRLSTYYNDGNNIFEDSYPNR